MKKTSFIFIVTLLFASQVVAQEGAWNITQGTGLDAKSYSGTLTLSKIGNAHDLLWETSIGGGKGISILQNDKLFAGFGSDQFGYGVVVYDIKADGTLEGTWAGNNMNGTTGTEKITSKNAKDLNGTYTIEGTYPSKKLYTGTITIKKTGSTYKCEWTVGTATYKGVGIVDGKKFAIGYGATGDVYGLVIYSFTKDKATGIWSFANATNTGVENIEKK